MSIRHLIMVGLLVAGALLVGVRVGAQADRVQTPMVPIVLAGPDVGFRVDGLNGATPIGRLVVRVKGKWVEAQIGGPRLQPAK